MYSVTTKLKVLALVAGLSLGAVACSSDSAKESATKLYEDAVSYFDNKQYSEAIALIDSLKKTYPEVIDVQRQAMHLRPMVDEQITLIKIAENDSLLSYAMAEVESLKNNFTHVAIKDMDGYYVHKKAKAKELVNRTGIEVRIDSYFNPYVVSLLNGPSVKHTHLTVATGNIYSSTDTVPYDKASNYRFKIDGINNEMVTFRGKSTNDFCKFIADNKGADIKLNYVGDRRHKTALTAQDKKIISETWYYVNALQKRRDAESMSKYLEARLKITREHIEKTEIK